MRKWLAFAVQVPFVAMMWTACNGDNGGGGDAGDASLDVRAEKTPLDVQAPETGPVCPTPESTIDTSQISWIPPVTPDPNACSDVQIQAYYSACLDSSTSTSKTCSAFTGDAANKTCLGCLITSSTASAYGALISYGGVDYANISGCIAIVTGDSSATGCGAKSEAVTQCESLACSNLCPVKDNASFALYQQCTKAADQAVCAPYVAAECNLADAGAVYTTCVNHTSFQDYYTALAPVFCGGYAADAGAGDAGTDAATDAATDATADAATDASDGATE